MHPVPGTWHINLWWPIWFNLLQYTMNGVAGLQLFLDNLFVEGAKFHLWNSHCCVRPRLEARAGVSFARQGLGWHGKGRMNSKGEPPLAIEILIMKNATAGKKLSTWYITILTWITQKMLHVSWDQLESFFPISKAMDDRSIWYGWDIDSPQMPFFCVRPIHRSHWKNNYFT